MAQDEKDWTDKWMHACAPKVIVVTTLNPLA